MKRNKVILSLSLCFNVILILSELFGLSEVFFRYLPGTEPFLWYDSLTYYTNLSNIALLIGSITALTNDILILRNREPKKAFSILKYTGVIVSMVTNVTVYFFVILTGEIRYGISVEGNMWLLLHTINPILGFCSYLFLDHRFLLEKKTIGIPLSFTMIYTIMIEIIYLCHGRVPYLSDVEGGKASSALILGSGSIETMVTLALSVLILFLNNHRIRKHSGNRERPV